MSRLPNCPHCGGRVRQYSRNNITNTASELYANCLNPACPEHGQTLVYTISYVRTAKRKIDVTLDLAKAVVSSLSREDVEALRNMLNTA